jgi:NodT family efflux transporter outer membrane factor (OMF) lipoprotein
LRKAIIAATLGGALLAGCSAVGPNYVRPALDAPPQWAEGAGAQDGKTEPSLEQTAWWKYFDDADLNYLMEEAVRSNLDVKQARARIIQARTEVVSAKAAGLPTANATASVDREDSGENTYAEGASTNATLYKTGFDASWEIDVFGGVRRSVEAAQARLDASREELNDTLLTLLGDVAKYYIELRASQEQLDITRKNVDAQQQSVEVARERHRLGLTSYLDAAQAQAQKTTTESDIPTYQNSIKQSIHRLGVLLGKEPGALRARLLEDRPLPKADGVVAVGLPSDLLTRRPDLRQAERNLAAASADIGVAVADLYPKFDLTLGLGVNSKSTGNLLSLSSGYWSLVPELSTLLFDGGKTRANIENKRAVYDETLAKYRSTFLTALEDVENALSAFQTEQARRKLLEDAVRSRREAVDLADELYRKGLTNFIDVLDAQRSLYSAQSSLVESESIILTNLVSLNKALGGGWDAPEIQRQDAHALPNEKMAASEE